MTDPIYEVLPPDFDPTVGTEGTAGAASTGAQAWLLSFNGQKLYPIHAISGDGANVHNGVGWGRITGHLHKGSWGFDGTMQYTNRADSTGNRILISDASGVVSSGVVTQLEVVDHTTDPDLRMVTWQWETEEHQLADRRIYPDPTRAASLQTTVSHDRRSGPASSVMMGYARDHASAEAPLSWRAVNGFTLAPDPVAGPAIRMAERFTNLLDCLQRAAIQSGLSFRVRRVGDYRTTQFEIYQTRDLSLPLFSIEAGTASRFEWSLHAPAATSVISGGVGELTARMFRESHDHETSQGWWRRIETFRDHRNEDDPLQLDADARAALLQAAQVQMAKIDQEALTFTYGRDWDLGDRVIVKMRGGKGSVRLPIQRVEWRITAAGIRYTPRLGDDAAARLDAGPMDARSRSIGEDEIA